MLDLSGLLNQVNSVPVDPKEIFDLSHYGYLRSVQQEVFDSVKSMEESDNQTNSNIIIKMNTGSGKTVVGLVLLKSYLNRQKGKAVYIVPDNYLTKQVIEESKKLGITCTDDVDDFSFSSGKSILVTNISTLVNGKSKFKNKIIADYLLIDDVHNCFNKIKQQYCLKIPSKDQLFDQIIDIVKEEWSMADYNSYNSYTNKIPEFLYQLPFYIWQNNYKEIQNIITSEYSVNQADDELHVSNYFKVDLVVNSAFKYCSCIITPDLIEIVPMGIDLSCFSGISKCKKRIFLTATLADDSVFASLFGSNFIYPKHVISPNNSNDLGCRLILAPQCKDINLHDDTIKEIVYKFSEKYNVSIIVPSFDRAKFWDPNGLYTVTKNNIVTKLTDLKSSQGSLTVFVNRYDGIDLKEDMYRLLIIDGLPPAHTLFDKYIRNTCCVPQKMLQHDMQTLEQGLGRAVRANNDYCCTILMGKDLIQRLSFGLLSCGFSDATNKQYEKSDQICDRLIDDHGKINLDKLSEAIQLSLTNDKNLSDILKNALTGLTYDTELKIDSQTIKLKKVWSCIVRGNINDAQKELSSIINSENDPLVKGLYLQYLASLYYANNKEESFKTQQSALKVNSQLSPNFQFELQSDKKIELQSASILKSCVSFNELLRIKSEIVNINFDLNSSEFETLIYKIGIILGFDSSRPDHNKVQKKTGGPDNLWISADKSYSYVIECKNECTSDTVSKSDLNQLRGSVSWFKSEYPKLKCVPVIIHKSKIIDNQATDVDDAISINEVELNTLIQKISNFVSYINSESNFNKKMVAIALQNSGLVLDKVFHNCSSRLSK